MLGDVYDRIKQEQQSFLEFLYQHEPGEFEYRITEVLPPSDRISDLLCDVNFLWRRQSDRWSGASINWNGGSCAVSKERFNTWIKSRRLLDFAKGRPTIALS